MKYPNNLMEENKAVESSVALKTAKTLLEKQYENHILQLEKELESRGLLDTVQAIRKAVNPCQSSNTDEGMQPLTEAAIPQDSPTKIELTQHPLLMEDIIKIVTHYLDFKTLISSREVHSSWNYAIVTHKYLQKSQLLLAFMENSKPNFNDFLKAFPIDNPELVQLHLPKTVLLTFFGKLAQPEKLIEWFKVYGKCFTRMEFNSDDVEDMDSYRCDSKSLSKSNIFVQLLSGLLPNLEELYIWKFDFFQNFESPPVLKKLKLLEIGTGIPFPNNVSPNILKNILRSAPNLQTLKLCFEPRGDQLEGQTEDYLKACFDAGNLINLVELNFRKCPLKYPCLEFLADVKFEILTSLVIDSICLVEYEFFNDLIGIKFTNLFENIKESLKNLEVQCTETLHFISTEMIKLTNIKCKRMDHMNTKSIKFVENAPNLEELIFTGNPFSIPCHLETVSGNLFPSDLELQHTSLKTLKLLDIQLDRGDFQKLVLCFPNLEILSVCSSDKVTREFLTGDLIRDLGQFLSDLTLLPKLKDLNFSVFCDGFDMNQWHFNQGIVQNFALLLALKKCRISCKFGTLPLWDKAVSDGFLKSPNLRYLELQNFVIEPEILSNLNFFKEKKVELTLLSCFNPINI